MIGQFFQMKIIKLLGQKINLLSYLGFSVLQPPGSKNMAIFIKFSLEILMNKVSGGK